MTNLELAPVNNPLLVSSGKGYTIGPRGAHFSPDLSDEDLSRLFKAVFGLYDVLDFTCGDLAEAYEKRHGKAFFEKLAILCQEAGAEDYWMDLVRERLWVAKNIKHQHRSKKLGFRYHREVAEFDPQYQQQWLSFAEDKSLSVSELRVAIRQDQRETPKLKWKTRFEPAAWALDGVRWFKKELEKQPVSEWPQERRALLKADLEPLVEIYNRL